MLLLAVLDVVAFKAHASQTLSHYIRHYVAGPSASLYAIIGAVLGGTFVWATDWVGKPDEPHDWVWWSGAVVMFTLFAVVPIDTLLVTSGSWSPTTPMVRQMLLGFILGGLLIHFTWGVG